MATPQDNWPTFDFEFDIYFCDQWGDFHKESALLFDRDRDEFKYRDQETSRIVDIDAHDIVLIEFHGRLYGIPDCYEEFKRKYDETVEAYSIRRRERPRKKKTTKRPRNVKAWAAMPLFAVMFFYCFLDKANAIVGYDCGGSTMNITTISLNHIGECDIPLTEPESKPVYIQLLQLSEFESTEVIQCKVEIDRTIYHCGMSSHNSIVRGGHQTYLHDFDEKSCQRLQETGMMKLSFTSEIVGLRRNETTSRSITLGGSLTNDGACSGTQYSDPYGTWNDAVVQASVKISLYNYQAIINLKAGKIILQSGTQCSLSEGNCIDTHGNSAFWKTAPTESCGFNQYDVLYEGIATKLESTEDGVRMPDVYSLKTESTTFALAKQSEYQVCGYSLIRTEHPKLFILETEKGLSPAIKKKISVNNLDIFSYINSKFIYVEKHVRAQMKNLYRDVISQRCNLERRVMQNALATAAILPEKFAYTVMKGPGYMAAIAGEVAHIVKCIPVQCQLRKTTECYHELPVTYRNASFFLTTTSRMLVKAGTQVECDPLLPTEYNIEGVWYRLSPHPIEVIPPQMLQPLSKPTWRYVTAGNLASSGIYTETDIDKLRNRIMFPAEKPALLNHLARGSSGYHVPPGSISIQGLMDEDTLNNIAENAAGRMWSIFLKFGTASAGMIGIFLIIKLIKLIIDTIIHGYALHSLYGWSIHLVGAIWSSVTNLLVTLAHGRSTPAADIEEADEPSAPRNAPLYPDLQQRESFNLSGIDPQLSARLFASRQQSPGTASD